MMAPQRNVAREPVVPARLTADALHLGVPHKINRTASSLLGEARERYGPSVERMVWAAIPWLEADTEPRSAPANEILPPILPEDCSFGVHQFYLTFAAWLYLDLVEMYDEAEAGRFWERVPFLPPLAGFHPLTWTVARGGKPY